MTPEEYKQYVVNSIGTLKALGWTKLIINSCLAFGAFYLAWNIRRWRDDARKERETAGNERKLVQQLLQVIKSWTVIQVTNQSEVARDVVEAVEQKAEVVAQKVVDKITEKHESTADSAKMPVYKPPSTQ